MHGVAVARALGCKRALLPRAAGAFCAMGMLQSDVRQDYLQVFLADLDKVDRPSLEAGFAQLETRARDALAAKALPRLAAIEREVDLRYDGQQWPVRVALGDGFDSGGGAQDVRGRASAPVRPHPAAAAASTSPRCASSAAGRSTGRRLPRARRKTRRPSHARRRQVWIDAAHGWRDVPVYDGAELRPGCTLDGPLLIEERTTTAFVGPRDRARGRSARRLPGAYRSRLA